MCAAFLLIQSVLQKHLQKLILLVIFFRYSVKPKKYFFIFAGSLYINGKLQTNTIDL